MPAAELGAPLSFSETSSSVQVKLRLRKDWTEASVVGKIVRVKAWACDFPVQTGPRFEAKGAFPLELSEGTKKVIQHTKLILYNNGLRTC